MPSPIVFVKKEPNNEPRRPETARSEPPQHTLQKQTSPANLSVKSSGQKKIEDHAERVSLIKAAGLMEQYKPICDQFDAGVKKAKSRYLESRAPVAKRNDQLLRNAPMKVKGDGTELERTRYKDHKKQMVECSRLFTALKAELNKTTEALEKTRDDAIDRLLALGKSTKPPPAVLPSTGSSSTSHSIPTPQPFRYAPVTPVALSISLPSRPDKPQGTFNVLPLPEGRQMKQESTDVNKRPVAANVPAAAAPPQHKLPTGTMVLPNKVLRRAGGECILRCVLHVLSRRFAFVSRDLFRVVYHKVYGSNIGDYNRFVQKPWKKFIDCRTNGRGTFYRLNPSYFLEIAKSAGLPCPDTNLSAEYSDIKLLPPITPMDPKLIKIFSSKLESSHCNLYTTDRILLPRILRPDVPLQDFQQYLRVWNSVSRSPLPNPPKIQSEPKPLPKKLKIGDITPQIYDQYIEAAASSSGMQAKRTRKVLTAYSTKMMRPIEEQRQALLSSTLNNTESETKDDSDTMDISDESDGDSDGNTHSDGDTQRPQDAHLGDVTDGDRDMTDTSFSSDGATKQEEDVDGDQDMGNISVASGESTQQEQDAHGDQDMGGAPAPSAEVSQQAEALQRGTSVPQKTVDDRTSTTTAPTRFAPYPSRNITSAQKQGEGALLTASGRKSDKDKAAEGGAIRSQKEFFKRPVLSGSLQSSSESKSFSLPHPILPEDPNRQPLPTWESQVRRGRFSGMTRHELHEARKEAREFLIDWMWSLPLRHGKDCPDKAHM
ncbi:hypothetical protein EMPS_11015 [Entomortierella parvispora]|uniref:Uncharacterized protein n=1 Tax=Entomortierella parvispora TaxID=205924 RepID=A0A9P3M1J8_9FUNG|nr:hypothetical protein EMPS_11015 [Entomortierella parvispora]